MIGNSSGSYKVTREADLAAYDRSPPLLRRILQQTIGDWAAPPLAKRWRLLRGGGLPEAAVARATLSDIRAIEARHTLKFYGPHHPEAARQNTRRPE